MFTGGNTWVNYAFVGISGFGFWANFKGYKYITRTFNTADNLFNVLAKDALINTVLNGLYSFGSLIMIFNREVFKSKIACAFYILIGFIPMVTGEYTFLTLLITGSLLAYFLFFIRRSFHIFLDLTKKTCRTQVPKSCLQGLKDCQHRQHRLALSSHASHHFPCLCHHLLGSGCIQLHQCLSWDTRRYPSVHCLHGYHDTKHTPDWPDHRIGLCQ